VTFINSHSHNHNHPQTEGKGLLTSIILNILITTAQAIGGFISGSLSLLSDAFHEFGINHVNIQPEFRKSDNKQIIVQD